MKIDLLAFLATIMIDIQSHKLVECDEVLSAICKLLAKYIGVTEIDSQTWHYLYDIKKTKYARVDSGRKTSETQMKRTELFARQRNFQLYKNHTKRGQLKDETNNQPIDRAEIRLACSWKQFQISLNFWTDNL